MRTTVHAFALLTIATSLAAQAAPEPRAVKISNQGTVYNDWIDVPIYRRTGDSSSAPRTFLDWCAMIEQHDPGTGLVGVPTTAGAASWSPDGRFVAYDAPADGLRGHYIWVLPVDSATGLAKGTPRRVTMRNSGPPAWSPDGRRIAFLSPDSTGLSLIAVPFNGGDEELMYRSPGRWVNPRIVVWTSDGQFLYTTVSRPGNAPELLRLNLATKRAEWSNDGFGMFAVSSDGKQVAKLTRATPYLDISPIPGSGASPQRFVVPNNTTPASWLSTTELVAVAHPLPASIERVSLADGTIRSITPLDSSGVGDAFYSPDGKRFAYTRNTDTGVQLIVADADGSHGRALGVSSSIGHISWSPSGAQIAYLSYAPLGIRIVDVASGSDRAITGAVNAVQQKLRWRGDGKAVWYMSWKPTATALTREVHEVTTDGKERLIAALPQTNQPPGFVNDTLLVILEQKGLSTINLKTGTTRLLYSGGVRANNGDIDVSRDGSWLALVSEEGISKSRCSCR